jgi:aminoglycoside phosphotransferase (APT) family kinase protein
MAQRFFSPKEDLDQIIRTEIPEVATTRQIVTGWTNIVIEATTASDEAYFFRFPRNPFWSKMIRKDAAFCGFIEGKTSFYTPRMRLCYDAAGRPFSVHRKIAGYALSDRIYHLSHTSVTAVAHDCAKFIYELSRVSVAHAPAKVRYPLEKFLRELDERHYDAAAHIPGDHAYIAATDNGRMVHGDLNLGNILLDENDRVTAVIDFCFAGTGNPNMDVSRVLSRPVPPSFEREFLAEYTRLAGGVDEQQVQKMTEIWGRIDAGYVGHIRRAHPEITLPEL